VTFQGAITYLKEGLMSAKINCNITAICLYITANSVGNFLKAALEKECTNPETAIYVIGWWQWRRSSPPAYATTAL